MTFRAIATGVNRFWGEKGKIIFLADYQVIYGLQERYIEGKLEYVGSGKNFRNQHLKEKKIGLPIKKVDVLKEMKMQTRALNRIIKELQFVNKKRNEIISLVKN